MSRPLAVVPGERVLVMCPDCNGSGTRTFTPRSVDGQEPFTVKCTLCDGKRTIWALPASHILFQGKTLPEGWRNVFPVKLTTRHSEPQFKWTTWVESLPSDQVIVLRERVRVVGYPDRKTPLWRIDYWDGTEWITYRKEGQKAKGGWKTQSLESALAVGQDLLENVVPALTSMPEDDPHRRQIQEVLEITSSRGVEG